MFYKSVKNERKRSKVTCRNCFFFGKNVLKNKVIAKQVDESCDKDQTVPEKATDKIPSKSQTSTNSSINISTSCITSHSFPKSVQATNAKKNFINGAKNDHTTKYGMFLKNLNNSLLSPFIHDDDNIAVSHDIDFSDSDSEEKHSLIDHYNDEKSNDNNFSIINTPQDEQSEESVC